MSTINNILRLSKQLLPTGRAFRAATNGNQEKMFKALAISQTKAYTNALSIFYAMIPDNNNFTAQDATDWERRLGMTYNPLAPLADRKLAILRKMAAPGRNPAKGHYLNIQQQLQDAGFNVYVHENINPVYGGGYTSYNPVTLNPAIFTQAQHGNFQHGQLQHGGYLNYIIANSLDNAEDIYFDTGANLRACFFIGGAVLGTYANVLATRETEFRQLVLNLKQCQNVAICFLNFI